MGMGRRKHRQDTLWVATAELPRTAGHVFYERVNRILNEREFDRFVEDACEKFYAAVMGRPSLAPGKYFWKPTRRCDRSCGGIPGKPTTSS